MDEGRGFTIIDYEDRYKQALEDISLPWLLEYDLLEPVDLEMLAEPHRFLSGGGRVLLARWGEEIVGMVMLELQGKGQCELLKFGVKEAYRGRGIGTALMEAALQAARDAGQRKRSSPPTISSGRPCGCMSGLGSNTSPILINGSSSPTSAWSGSCEPAYREKYPGSAPAGGAGVFFTTRSLRTGELGDVVDPLPGAEAVQANAELDELLGHDAHIDPEDAPLEHQAEQGGQGEGDEPQGGGVDDGGGPHVAAAPQDAHGVDRVEGPQGQKDADEVSIMVVMEPAVSDRWKKG